MWSLDVPIVRQRYFSNIYWHFTGSPDIPEGSSVKRPADLHDQGLRPKPADEATDTAEKILASKELWATAQERLTEKIVTNKFCCVTDIPMKDLLHHAAFYGKVAIGFRAEAVHHVDFVPVLYFPEMLLPAFTALVPGSLDPALVRMANEFDQFEIGSGSSTDRAYQNLMNQARRRAEEQGTTEKRIDEGALVENFLVDYLKITGFDSDPSQTFYAEREWRKIANFVFRPVDVAAVVAPEEHLPRLGQALRKLGYPENLSLLSWEFVESA